MPLSCDFAIIGHRPPLPPVIGHRTGICGDDIVDTATESCDDGNMNGLCDFDGDGIEESNCCTAAFTCTSSCKCEAYPICGDGRIDSGESCDPPGSRCRSGPSSFAFCDSSCRCGTFPGITEKSMGSSISQLKNLGKASSLLSVTDNNINPLNSIIGMLLVVGLFIGILYTFKN